MSILYRFAPRVNPAPVKTRVLFTPAFVRHSPSFGRGVMPAQRERLLHGPDALSDAQWTGFRLGLQAIDANPPRAFSEAEREAFLAGVVRGFEERDAREEQERDEALCMSRSWDIVNDSRDEFETWEESELCRVGR